MRNKLWMAALFLAGLSACNNYNLLEKLENPGGSKPQEEFTSNYYVFVSSWETKGDMSGQPFAECNAPMGIGRADCACTRAAASRNLRKNEHHQFRAYLSMPSPSTLDPKCHVAGLAQGCSPSFPGPWLNTQGQVVVNNFIRSDGMLDSNAVRYTEMQAVVPAGAPVWTGAGATGNVVSPCGQWDDASNGTNGSYGAADSTGATWQNNGTPMGCDQLKRIYCFATPY